MTQPQIYELTLTSYSTSQKLQFTFLRNKYKHNIKSHRAMVKFKWDSKSTVESLQIVITH